MKTTQVKAEHVVKALNNWLEARESVIRLKNRGNTIDISLPEDSLIDNFIVNPKKEFYVELEKNLKDVFGITGIRYNNTWSCFWHENIVR